MVYFLIRQRTFVSLTIRSDLSVIQHSIFNSGGPKWDIESRKASKEGIYSYPLTFTTNHGTFKVAFDAELLMMPRDKDVQVILLDEIED